MNTNLIKSGIIAVAIACPGTAAAAIVDWESPRDINSYRNIIIGGDLIAAVNMDDGADVVVTGDGLNITFTPDNSLFANTPFTTGFGPSTGDTGFDAILNRADWDSTSPNATVVRIDGLESGQKYAIQFFVADTRAAYNNRTMTITTSGNGQTSSVDVFMGSSNGSPRRAQYVIGNFTADATFQDFNFIGSHGSAPNLRHPQLNAYVLRKVDRTALLPGESRFNAFKYKASHNSYDRDEPLDEQIDDYNVWCVELDLKYDRDEAAIADQIKVEHLCADPGVGQNFDDALTALNRSTTAEHKATVLWLQLSNGRSGNGCGYDKWESSEQGLWLVRIKNSLKNKLGAYAIYHSDEFINSDDRKWPSHQELSRRGYKWIVVIDRGDTSGVEVEDDDLLFSEIVHATAGGEGSNAFRSFNGGTDVNTHQYSFADNDDRWMRRAWPSTQSCISSDGNYWDNAIAEGFNLIATNCVDNADMVTDTNVHSPIPLHVDFLYGEDEQWGTEEFPMNNFDDALARISGGGLILVEVPSGTTRTATLLTDATWSDTCVIRATAGTVVINAP